jgi:uncharacterized SAM-binding protein YcdF (DUF218 family)
MAGFLKFADLRRWRQIGFVNWCLRLTILLMLWLAGVALYIVQIGARDDATNADAVIVLGAAAYDAVPSPVFEQRILHGIDLHRRGLAPILIFTGGFGRGARFAEAQVARRYTLRKGVADSAILIETLSHDTRENIAQAAQLMQSHGLRRAIIVSDPMHMSRALRLCQEIGLECLGSPTPTSLYRSAGPRWKFLAKEVYFFHRDLLTSFW